MRFLALSGFMATVGVSGIAMADDLPPVYQVSVNHQVIYGYLISPDKDQNNFIGCDKQKLKVDEKQLRMITGGCMPNPKTTLFAGIVKELNSSQIILFLSHGGSQKFEWDPAKLGSTFRPKPGDQVLVYVEPPESVGKAISEGYFIKPGM
jgi:hypothetical protein